VYLVTKLRNGIVKTVFLLLFRPEGAPNLVRIGTKYGGWWVPTDLLGDESICYCGGVGTDVSFDLGLIERFGCRVWGIDPTPKAIDWIRGQKLDDRFALVPVGISGAPGELRFYSPKNPNHVSHSVQNLQRTETYFTARVETIAGLMAELSHDHVDLIKLDIEGAEHDAIKRMLLDGIRPRALCVEFDQPEPVRWARATTNALKAAGYTIGKVDRFNVLFIRRDP
jgi:FkbM family methyltransferase